MTSPSELNASSAEAAPLAVRHLATRARSKTVPLEWPVEYDGKAYTEVVVRRMSTAEVAEFVEQLETAGGTARIFRFPMFHHPDGTRLSDALFDLLDDDDTAALVEAAVDFLPRRFATREPAPDTTRGAGANTAATSAA